MAYVKEKDIKVCWSKWADKRDQQSWEELFGYVYLICEGVAKKFHPKSQDEYHDHIHDACTAIMQKIKDGKLQDQDRGTVFSLFTTAVFRVLYTKVTKEKKKTEQNNKYRDEIIKQASQNLNDAICI